MREAKGALGGVTVVDLSTDVAGAYAGKLLADLGARVVVVEPHEGSPLRARPPELDEHHGGLAFEYLSGGKESVVPHNDDDAATFLRALLARSDVLIDDGTSPWRRAVPSLRPETLVEVDISPFGRSGPYAGWHPSDLAVWAMGGYHYFTGAPDREPVWLPGSHAQLHAGAHAAFAALAALAERRRSGFGQTIEVSALESVLTAHAWLVSSWAACGQALLRQPYDLIQAADGEVYMMRIAPNEHILTLIDRPDLHVDDLFTDVPTWFANIPRVFEAVAAWAKDRTVEEIVTRGQELRVAVTPVLDAAGVAEDPQLAARDWWEQDDTAADLGVRFPGQPYKLSATPSARPGPGPAPGQHTSAIRAEVGEPAWEPRAPSVPPSGLALEGLAVVEVTTNWAGPACGRFLADLGAAVTKVERAAKPATRTLFWVGPTQNPQRQGHHRAMYFNELNRNKRDVCLDLSRPEGREAFEALVRRADVLIENNAARVMPNLGLGWEELRQVNPALVMISMSGYGATGPRRDWAAYGANIETTSGLTSVSGYPDGQRTRTTLFYADPVSGIHGAVAVLAALEWRARSGEGQFIDLALNESGAVFCADQLLAYASSGEVPRPAGNRDPRFAPQGVYRCAGDDHWLAVCCQDDATWPALARTLGRADLAEDAGLAHIEGRAARHDELDVAITLWASELEQYEAAWALQRAGVSAAPVLANWQVLADPHIWRRRFYQDQEHPVVGVYPTPTWPWRFGRTPAELRRPAPLFAEHNRAVLHEAGLDEEAIDRLYAAGVTADQPEPT